MVYSAGLKYRWNIFFFWLGTRSGLLFFELSSQNDSSVDFGRCIPLLRNGSLISVLSAFYFTLEVQAISRTWSRLESETNNWFFSLADGTRSSNPGSYLPYLSMETSTSTYLSLWWHYFLQVRTDSSRSKIVGPIYNICYMYYQKQMVYGSLSFPESLKQVRFPVILCLHY